MGEVADLFASLGLRIDEGAWARGNTKIGETAKALDGAFQDKNGRWRAASGRFLSMGEKAQLATTGVKGLGDAAEKAHRKTAESADKMADRASKAFDRIGTAIKGYLVYLGGREAYDHLIKFNSEMQDATISLAAMIEGQLGGSFQDATSHAKELYAQWQKFSTQTPVTTAEIVDFGKNIAAATFNAGGKLDDLRQITEQGVIAAKVLAGNRNAGYAALEISEMLSGNVSNRMMFVKQLLGMVHMTAEQFRELDSKGRLAIVKKALGSDAFKDAAKAFGDSFSGVTSTLIDKLQIALGKVGLPLFEKITAAVASFNAWLDRNDKTIKRVGDAIADGLAVAWDLVVAIWNKAYRVFSDNRDVIAEMAEKIGGTLWAALQAIVFVLDAAIDEVDRFLHAMDHGFGKFLLDAFEMPGLLTLIVELLGGVEDKLGNIRRIAFGGLITNLTDFIDYLNPDQKERASPPRVSARGVVSQRADEIEARAKKLHAGPNTPEAQEEYEQLVERYTRLRTLATPTPTLPPSAAPATGRTISIGQVSVGDITVHSPNADPVAVGEQVRKTFHEELGGVLRQTMDVYG